MDDQLNCQGVRIVFVRVSFQFMSVTEHADSIQTYVTLCGILESEVYGYGKALCWFVPEEWNTTLCQFLCHKV